MGLFSYVDNKGYKRRKSDGKPIHRIIAEKKNGGTLKKEWFVHNKNRNKIGKNASYKGGQKEIGNGFILLGLIVLVALISSGKKQKVPDEQLNQNSIENTKQKNH